MQHYLPYLQWIDHQRNAMKDLVISWGNINTHATNYTGLTEQMIALKKNFEVLGGTMKEVDLPSYTVVDDHGIKSQKKLGRALYIEKRPEASLQVLFAGHMDTVYSEHSSFQKVEDIDDIKLHGPGVCDMKGGLVVMLTALQALEKSPYAEHIGWQIIINPDEEIGSPGSHGLYQQAASRANLGLLFEPSHMDGSIVSSRAGSMKLSILVKGKAAHAGRDYAKGRSSIFALAPLIVELEALNTLKPNGDDVANFDDQVIVNCGELRSGTGYNVVPDLAVLRVNVRAARPELLKQVRAKIEDLIKKHSIRDGIWMELHDDGTNPPKLLDAGTQKIIKWLEESAADLGFTLTTKPSRGACDGSFLAACGLSCVDSLGVTGGNIHTHDEFLLIDSLPARAKLTALFILRLASGEYVCDVAKPVIAL